MTYTCMELAVWAFLRKIKTIPHKSKTPTVHGCRWIFVQTIHYLHNHCEWSTIQHLDPVYNKVFIFLTTLWKTMDFGISSTQVLCECVCMCMWVCVYICVWFVSSIPITIIWKETLFVFFSSFIPTGQKIMWHVLDNE